jgi:D-alanine-D-alanine ligase
MFKYLKPLQGKKIGVIAGGVSRERAISLLTGRKVESALREQKLKSIFIDPKQSNWIEKIKKIDVAFIALHGKGGEDGTLQGLLEWLNIPYTGSGVLASALSLNKVIAKQVFLQNKVPTPPFISLTSVNELKEKNKSFNRLSFPVIVKPCCEGSSIGTKIFRTPEALLKRLPQALKEFQSLLIEEFIKGQDITVGILEETPLPILELVSRRPFYDYKAKYTHGLTKFIIPARLPQRVYTRAQKLALLAHKALGCEGYSRVDLKVENETNKIFVLEVNTAPGLTELSDLPAQAKAAGISYSELILRILYYGLKKKNGLDRNR